MYVYDLPEKFNKDVKELPAIWHPEQYDIDQVSPNSRMASNFPPVWEVVLQEFLPEKHRCHNQLICYCEHMSTRKAHDLT